MFCLLTSAHVILGQSITPHTAESLKQPTSFHNSHARKCRWVSKTIANISQTKLLSPSKPRALTLPHAYESSYYSLKHCLKIEVMLLVEMECNLVLKNPEHFKIFSFIFFWDYNIVLSFLSSLSSKPSRTHFLVLFQTRILSFYQLLLHTYSYPRLLDSPI